MTTLRCFLLNDRRALAAPGPLLLVRCAVVALALTSATAAWASIVYVDIPDTEVVVSENIVVIDLDRDGPGPHVLTVPWNGGFDSRYDLVVGQASTALIGLLEHVEFTMLNGQSWANANAAIVNRLPENTVIGPGSVTWFGGNSWLEYQGNGVGAWDGFNGVAFIGFRFNATPTPGNHNYGWFRVNYEDAADRVTLLDYAYESTPNAAIVASSGIVAVPESSPFYFIASLVLAGLVAQIGRTTWKSLQRQPN